jgi:hypothetical protein
VDITVTGPSGTVIATHVQMADLDYAVFDDKDFGTYTMTAVPRDQTWFGPLTSSQTKTTCGFPVGIGGFLPFLKSDTYICASWCGSSFVKKHLYLTDGAGTHDCLYTGGGAGDVTWEADSDCGTTLVHYTMVESQDPFTLDYVVSLTAEITDKATGAFIRRVTYGQVPFTCSPFAASWHNSDDACVGSITVSE